jgi:chromosome segregation ATPase
MSGFTGASPGDNLLSLLSLIKEPHEHEKRIKEFQEREKSALAAEAKLSASKSNLATDRTQLKEDQAAHEGVVAAFLPEKKRILAKASAFDEIQHKLDAREAAVLEREATLKKELAARATEWASATALMTRQKAELEAREAQCLRRESDLAAKEKQAADKLDRIRQFAAEHSDV